MKNLVILMTVILAAWSPAQAGHHFVIKDSVYTNDSLLVIGSGDTLTLRNCILTQNNHIGAVGKGLLILENDSIALKGDIITMDSAAIRFKNCGILWNTRFIYQYNIYAVDTSRITMDSTNIHIPVSAGMAITGHSTFDAMHTTWHGIWTVSAMSHARLSFTDCSHPHEFVVFDTSRLVFTRCPEVLVWLTLPEGSKGELTLPGDSTYEPVDTFYIGPQSTDLTGIPYEVIMDSTTNIWGCFPEQGCSVTVKDSRLRVMGFTMGDNEIEYHVKNLHNAAYYANSQLPFPDRRVILENTYVKTLNFYGQDSAHIMMDTCTVGEILAMQHSRLDMKNVTVDGTGGYFGVEAYSVVTAEECGFTDCAITARDRARLTMNRCSCRTVQALDNSSIFAATCIFSWQPEAYDSGAVLSVALNPPADFDTLKRNQPLVADIINIAGPERQPVTLEAVACYTPARVMDVHWLAMDYTPVRDGDTLLVWNTDSLSDGDYYVGMFFAADEGDTLESFRVVTVLNSLGLYPFSNMEPEDNDPTLFPNPFINTLRLLIPGPDNAGVDAHGTKVRIYSAAGNLVRQWDPDPDDEYIVWDGRDKSGYTVSPGYYLVELRKQDVKIKKLLLKR